VALRWIGGRQPFGDEKTGEIDSAGVEADQRGARDRRAATNPKFSFVSAES
jgi:hypothetical protein